MKLDLLFEAIDYSQMFDKKFTDFVENIFNINGQAEARKWIRIAKTSLNRDDRIVWFLRTVKLTILAQSIPLILDDENYDSSINYVTSEFKKYNSKTKGKKFDPFVFTMLSPFSINSSATFSSSGTEGFTKPLDRTLRDLSHYLSLPINKIQTYIFSWQTWEDISDEWREYEKAWQEERKGTIPVREKDAIFLDAGDNFFWVDLKKTGCREEGEAMGHCGNVPMGNDPDITILSLRQQIKKEQGMLYWKPWATFIFNKKTGMFGEMKGRSNNKPAEAYHKYIIPLLKDKRVKGIEGGGYAPEMNFAITDLPEATWKSLVKVKPRLMTDIEYLRKVSSEDDRAAVILKQEFGLTKDGKSLVVEDYNNMGDYVKYNSKNNESMSKLAWALDIFNGEDHLEISTDSAQDWESLYDYNLNKDEIDILDKLEENDESKFDEIKDELLRAYWDARISGTESEMYKEFEHAVKKGLSSGTHDNFELVFENEKQLLDSKVYITLPMKYLKDYLEDDNIGSSIEGLKDFISEDVSSSHIDFTEPYNGFDGFDEIHWEEEKKNIFKSI